MINYLIILSNRYFQMIFIFFFIQIMPIIVKLKNKILVKKLAHNKYKRTNLEKDYKAFSDLRAACKN